eukprot:scaffold16873_cov24-Tisochrysis_lutea.AAC.3
MARPLKASATFVLSVQRRLPEGVSMMQLPKASAKQEMKDHTALIPDLVPTTKPVQSKEKRCAYKHRDNETQRFKKHAQQMRVFGRGPLPSAWYSRLKVCFARPG